MTGGIVCSRAFSMVQDNRKESTMYTVIGLFDQNDQADQVVKDLKSGGFDGNQISEAVRAGAGSRFKEDQGINVPGVGSMGASGPLHRALSGGANRGELVGSLRSLGVPEGDAQTYAEGVRRGATLVAVTSEDTNTDRAVEIMCRHGAINCAHRSEQWRQQGWAGFDASAAPLSDTDISAERTRAGEQTAAIPVVEEDIRVGKREVESGGVRVWKHTTETPVEEDVHLRQEHVRVERRPVDRPITDADAGSAFKDETIEVSERREEAVVEKDARVTEEVVISKDVEDHTEKVRDTVRKTEVEVEQARPGQAARGETRQGDATRSKTKR